ncbi:MAG: YlxR family protein [Kineosporiaceae bacterium]
MGCRRRERRSDLLRVVAELGPDGIVLVPDPLRVHPGRGASVHRDPDCLAAAVSRRAFPRALRVAPPVDVSALRTEIDGGGSCRAPDPAEEAGGRSEREQVDE